MRIKLPKITAKLILFGLFAMIALFVVAELVFRFAFGLGNPPLMQAHPTIEYMYKPNGEYFRYGNRFAINEYGMRSDSFPAERQGGEIRILIIGDSVPNGGNQTDQAELASELIKVRVSELIHAPVIVGNISAASWSFPNQLAYLREYGTFGADVAVIIMNKVDMIDYPSFQPLDPGTQPTKSPLFATEEVALKYAYPRIAPLVGLPVHYEKFGKFPDGRADCRQDLTDMIDLLQSNGVQCFLAYHPSASELTRSGEFTADSVTLPKIIEVSDEREIPVLNIADEYQSAIKAGAWPLRDAYHPSPLGQKLIADAIFQGLDQAGLITEWKQDQSDLSP